MDNSRSVHGQSMKREEKKKWIHKINFMLQFTCLALVIIDTKEKVEAYKPSVCVHNVKAGNDKVSKQKSAQFGLQLLTAW